MLGKLKRLDKLVRAARKTGRPGTKARKKLGRQLAGLVKQLQRTPAKKLATTLQGRLVPLARSAQGALEA